MVATGLFQRPTVTPYKGVLVFNGAISTTFATRVDSLQPRDEEFANKHALCVTTLLRLRTWRDFSIGKPSARLVFWGQLQHTFGLLKNPVDVIDDMRHHMDEFGKGMDRTIWLGISETPLVGLGLEDSAN